MSQRYNRGMNKALAVVVVFCATAAPSSAISEAPQNDAEHNTLREQEFATFNPRFKELKAERIALLRTLNAVAEERETARQSTLCSHQILWELKLMIYLTADFTAIDRRIRDLRSSLDHPEREASADAQNPEDGSFGSCYESWPLKLAASYDHRGDKAARPFRFRTLRVTSTSSTSNTPEKPLPPGRQSPASRYPRTTASARTSLRKIFASRSRFI